MEDSPYISIAYLEPASTQADDPYNRIRPNYPGSVYVEGDTETNKSYELDAILSCRTIKDRKDQTKVQYMIRWKDYGSEWDEWRNESNLDNVRELVDNYKQLHEASRGIGTGRKIGRKGRTGRS